jgi:hypothetical protein
VLVVGEDADVCAALHGAMPGAGHSLWCLPSPADLEAALRLAAPQLVALVLPAAPDASWGTALASAAAAARLGVRVVVIAPARDVVEPLAAVAGAERALSRADVIARPLLLLDRPASSAVPAPPPPRLPDPPGPSPVAAPPPAPPPEPPRPARRTDLAALIDEELVDEPRNRPRLHRVEVNVSLVSEHNFYVGATRRVDSGGVFVSTVVPPPPGTRLQIRLGLADGRKVDVEGEVAFVREKTAIGGRQMQGCGVRLLGLPGWAVDAIERFVQARPPIVYVAR